MQNNAFASIHAKIITVIISEGGGTGRRAGLRNLSRKLRKPASLNAFSNGVNPSQTEHSFLLYPHVSSFVPVFPQKWSQFGHTPFPLFLRYYHYKKRLLNISFIDSYACLQNFDFFLLRFII